MSDSDANPSSTSVQGDSGKGGSGRGGRGKRSTLGDVGQALSAAYRDTLKEDIPPDILDLLGKLD